MVTHGLSNYKSQFDWVFGVGLSKIDSTVVKEKKKPVYKSSVPEFLQSRNRSEQQFMLHADKT